MKDEQEDHQDLSPNNLNPELAKTSQYLFNCPVELHLEVQKLTNHIDTLAIILTAVTAKFENFMTFFQNRTARTNEDARSDEAR